MSDESPQHEDRRGRCYDLAALYVVDHRDDDSLLLCHGWPVLQGDDEHAGKRYGHAWVERTTEMRFPMEGHSLIKVPIVECWDTMTQKWWPHAIYYYGGKIESSLVAKYCFADAREMLLDTEDYGPWHESPYSPEETAPFGETNEE
jgi:hypothetical protein